MAKVTVEEIEGYNQIVIACNRPKKSLKLEMNSWGYIYDKARACFRTPLYENSVLRLDEIKKILPVTWTTKEVQIFLNCL